MSFWGKGFIIARAVFSFSGPSKGHSRDHGHDHHDGVWGLKSIFSKIGEYCGWKGKDRDDDCEDCEDKFTATDNVVINGDAAANEIRPGDGNQTVYGRGGNDNIAGGNGDDELSGGDGDDSVAGNDGNDIICGGAGNDLLLGNAGIDKVYGGTGNDSLFGGAGNDELFGDAGNDTLQGDKGDDVLTGGDGADILVFRTGDGHDIVSDFDVRGSVQDSIDLTAFGTAFDTYAEIEAAMVEQDGDTLIVLGADQSILLRDVVPEDLSAGNFIL